MSRQLSTDRAHVKRITAAAMVLALAAGAATVPLGPALPVAHAQVAPVPQDRVSHGAVRQTFGVNPDWEASVFFSDAMTVRTVAVDFVPQKTGQSALERPEQAPKDDPVFNVIPETATYTVKHYKQVNRRTVEAATYEVTGRRSQAETPSGNWAIRIAYDLPDVAVEKNDRLALFATGMGAKYPKPLAGGDIRFTMPRINSGFGGTIRVHNPDAEKVEPPKLLLQQGTTTTDVPVAEDGTYELTINGASGTYTAKVVPPAGFASPEPRTWDVASGAPERDFDVYPITVSGQLLDASGPVAGSKVSIAGRSTTTDQDGNFTVTKVPVGTHDLVFGETTTTEERTVNGVVVSDQRDNWIGEQRVNEKPQFGTVSGRVVDPDGNGVANVTVQVGNRSATTSTDGTYSISDVPAGSVTVEVDARTVPSGYSVSAAQQKELTTTGLSGVDFNTTRDTGTVSGKVVDPSGNGVANVTVQAGNESAQTSADGTYSIAGVPTGLTTIKVTVVPTKYLIPAARQENVAVGGVSGVNFPLALKPTPTPKPSPTTPKPTPTPTPKPTTSKPTPTHTTPKLTTAKPKPTTPKPSPTTSKPTLKPTPTPTPKPTTTQPLAPTVGSVSGKVTDASGKVVPGATVTARDANGKEYTIQVAKDGTFQLNNLPPGNYTVTVGVPKGHVAPPPANVTVKAGQTVRLPGFVVEPEKPKARFDWDRVVVKPGETQVSAPKRSGDTTSAPSFRTTGVTKVSPDGKTTQIPAEDRWMSVEKDGTVVARPPRNTAPGEYRVVAKDSAGQTHTITVEVAQPAPMAKQHEVRFPLIPVPAGATRQAGRPRATVTDGPFVYQDRRVPEGARYDVDPAFASWVRADDNGRLTFTPPRDAKPGIRTIPVKVTFPDNSARTYNAEVEIGDPLLALTTELGYEEGLSVRPGEGVTVLRTGATALPEGTTFKVDRSTPLDGWVAMVDAHSGDLRLFAPKQGSDVEVPVIAYFADGSSTELTAGVRLSTSSALSNKHSPSYADVSAAPGGTATVGLTGSVPSGTTFVVVDGGGLRNVDVDRQTGSLKIQLAPDAQRDTPYTVTVRVRYADGSTEEIAAKVTAVSDAVRFSPQVAGGDGASVRTGLPRGAKLVDFDHTGWDVAFDSATGELTATPNSDVPAGTVLKVPVKATFPDGSTKIVEYPVTATAAPETKPQQGSSASAGWIAVVLGALVAIAGVGYAAFLNQDAIRAQLKQFGF